MSAGVLTKIIPTRKKTVEFLWIKRDFMEMSSRYREVRKLTRHARDTCFWCKHKFDDGEMMGLGAITGKLNQIICGECIDSAQGGRNET